MLLKRWLVLIGILVVWGGLQITWRNAIVMKGYDVGQRLADVNRTQTKVRWETTQVIELTSPVHLAKVSTQRKLGLVARSTMTTPMTAAPSLLQLATIERDASD